ncbi:hypothetical protein ACWDUD_28030 [Rhodococcus sp. NPDC003382]
MPLTYLRCRAVLATVAAACGLATVTACGGAPRDAAAVSTSFSGAIVTPDSTDLGSIVIGWGQEHAVTAITTPRPEDVAARCTGRGEDLAVDITAPHGWTIRAGHGSPILTVENTEQSLVGVEIDTTDQFVDVVRPVDWSEANQLDIAAAVAVPAQWNPTDETRVYLSIHVDCR